MGGYLLGIGKDIFSGYFKDFLKFGEGKLLDFVGFISKKYQYNKKGVLEILRKKSENLGSDFQETLEKVNYKDATIFKIFDKEKVNKMIDEIFKKEKIYENIKEKAKKKFDYYKIDNDKGIFTILLRADNNKNITQFMKVFLKIFEVSKNKKNKLFIKFENEIPELKGKIYKIKLLEDINDDNSKEKFDCIWNFVNQDSEEDNNNEYKNNFKNKEKYKNKPILNIYFKDRIEPGKIGKYSDLNISLKNANYMKLITDYIIDINQINEEIKNNKNIDDIKKPFLNLIEKTCLNILIKNHEIENNNKSKEIINFIEAKIDNFSFGNKIMNLAIMNNQITQFIFKKFFFEKKLPNSIKKISKEFLQNYQNFLKNRKNSFFSSIFLNVKNQMLMEKREEKMGYIDKIKELDNNKKDKIKEINLFIELNDIIILSLNKIAIFEDKKEKSKDEMLSLNSKRLDDLNEIIQTYLEDYCLKKSSIFINEIITNALKEAITYNYTIRLIRDYFVRKNELVFK